MVNENVIYKLTSPEGKVYIGQTRNLKARMSAHRAAARSGSTMLNLAVTRYGWVNFSKEVLAVYCGSDTQAGLDDLEAHYIMKYNAIIAGYNVAPPNGGKVGNCAEAAGEKSASLGHREDHEGLCEISLASALPVVLKAAEEYLELSRTSSDPEGLSFSIQIPFITKYLKELRIVLAPILSRGTLRQAARLVMWLETSLEAAHAPWLVMNLVPTTLNQFGNAHIRGNFECAADTEM